MSTHQQLEILINQLLNVRFVTAGMEQEYKRIPTGVSDFNFHKNGIEPFLTHYFADKDESGFHIYASIDDCVIYLAETLDFLDKEIWGFNDKIYEQVSLKFEQEYEAVRERITQLIGSPKYINDHYSDFAYHHRKNDNKDSKSRDIPLELQMIHHMGEFRLTYWIIDQRVLYLTIAHMDKEEALNIALGSRPLR